MESRELPKSANIVVLPNRTEGFVDLSLIPEGKDPFVYDAENGLNLPEVYDASWAPE